MDSGTLQVALKDPIVWQHATDLNEYLATDAALRMGYGQPLVRQAVIQDSEKTYVVWTCLPCVMDGWTRRLLLEDLESYLANPVAFTAKPYRPQFKDLEYLAQPPDTKPLYTIPENYTAGTNHDITREIFVDRPTRGAITFSIVGQAALALAVGQVTESRELPLSIVRGARTEPMEGVESVTGPLLSRMLLKIQLPPEEPVSMFLRKLQDVATQMLKYEAFSLRYSRAYGNNRVSFNWHPRGSDILSRIARFHVGEDEASLKVVRDQFPNGYGGVGCIFDLYDLGDHLRISTKFDANLLEVSLIEKVQDLFVEKLKKICGGQEMSVGSLMA